jgi:protein-disulfide isomerase
MTRTRWIIFILIVVATLGGLIAFSKKDTVNVDSVDPTQIIASTDTIPGDHVFGNKDAKVILFEYGDFQCPGCGGAYPQLKQISETYKDKIAFVFRNFPLTTIHPNALAAATAAEAAGLQNKFWEMHDKLYENQTVWSDIDASKRTDMFAGYAQDLGLNVEQFKSDLSNPKVVSKIDRDRALASKLNLTGTPSVLIGANKLDDESVTDLISNTGDKLRDKLDAALKSAGVTPPKR